MLPPGVFLGAGLLDEAIGDPEGWPRFQSSIRAWIATAMPISATAMNTQRKVSR